MGGATPELSRPIPVDRVGMGGLTVTVTADEAELAAVARRLMVPSVGALQCVWRLQPGAGQSVDAEGSLQAQLHQVCVVSLDPFPVEIVEQFSLRFVPAGSETESDDPDAPDEIAWQGGALELGDAAVEQLALALDPYPRKPGAELPQSEQPAEATPFSALAKLRPLL